MRRIIEAYLLNHAIMLAYPVKHPCKNKPQGGSRMKKKIDHIHPYLANGLIYNHNLEMWGWRWW